MTESVQCAECGRDYDSDEHPFCPRCGAIGRVEGGPTGPASQLARRRDPRKRPVQAAGVMMVSLAGFAFLLFAITAVMAPSLVPDTMEAIADYEGGDVRILVTDAGAPVAGANITVRTLDGTAIANASTDDQGMAVVTDLSHAGTNVTVDAAGGPFQRFVLSLPASSGGDITEVAIDIATDPRTSEDWVGAESIVTASRILASVFATVALVTIVGGVAAIRMRGRQWAIAGAAVAIIPALLLAMVSWIFFLFPILFVWALMVFIRSKALFSGSS